MSDTFEKVIYENLDKGYQVRLVVSTFNETEYFHIRKYFLTYEGTWQASKEGISIPATIQNTFAMLDGLLDICSKYEGEDVISHYYGKIKNT